MQEPLSRQEEGEQLPVLPALALHWKGRAVCLLGALAEALPEAEPH